MRQQSSRAEQKNNNHLQCISFGENAGNELLPSKTHRWSLSNNSSGVVFKFILLKFRMDKFYSICDTHTIMVIILIVWNSLWDQNIRNYKRNNPYQPWGKEIFHEQREWMLVFWDSDHGGNSLVFNSIPESQHLIAQTQTLNYSTAKPWIAFRSFQFQVNSKVTWGWAGTTALSKY